MVPVLRKVFCDSFQKLYVLFDLTKPPCSVVPPGTAACRPYQLVFRQSTCCTLSENIDGSGRQRSKAGTWQPPLLSRTRIMSPDLDARSLLLPASRLRVQLSVTRTSWSWNVRVPHSVLFLLLFLRTSESAVDHAARKATADRDRGRKRPQINPFPKKCTSTRPRVVPSACAGPHTTVSILIQTGPVGKMLLATVNDPHGTVTTSEYLTFSGRFVSSSQKTQVLKVGLPSAPPSAYSQSEIADAPPHLRSSKENPINSNNLIYKETRKMSTTGIEDSPVKKTPKNQIYVGDLDPKVGKDALAAALEGLFGNRAGLAITYVVFCCGSADLASSLGSKSAQPLGKAVPHMHSSRSTTPPTVSSYLHMSHSPG